MVGRVEKYLLDEIESAGAIHITLIDPEKTTPSVASRIAQEAESSRTAAIMIGGSTLASTQHLDKVVKATKEAVDLPVILFPNNITGISRHADALWFMSLLNSGDPYFITGAQVLSAPIIRRFKLEAIPLGYVIIGEGSAASVVGRAYPIPYNKPALAAAHALAAQYLGMRFVYLEAGSGASQTVPSEMIRTVKEFVQIPVIVGGGIRTGKQAREIAGAGADIIVTGTIVEESKVKETVNELVKNMSPHTQTRKA
jgi:phosphoglycerol geranylgeranyltransferase